MGYLLQARHSSSNLFLTISTWLKKKKTVQVRDGVQLVECLISIHEALGLSPSTIKRGRGRRRKWVDKGREEGRWYRQNHEHPFKGVSGIHQDTLRDTQQGKQPPWSFILLGGWMEPAAPSLTTTGKSERLSSFPFKRSCLQTRSTTSPLSGQTAQGEGQSKYPVQEGTCEMGAVIVIITFLQGKVSRQGFSL